MKTRNAKLTGRSLLAFLLLTPSGQVLAGPPFLTDDPETVEYHVLFSAGKGLTHANATNRYSSYLAYQRTW